jgi:hypothetical protein
MMQELYEQGVVPWTNPKDAAECVFRADRKQGLVRKRISPDR